MTRVIFHLDMDAFFASIEQHDNPALKGKPVIVGSPPERRGVVCAASYEARKFGVHAAMPSSTAGRLCPKGIFITPRMERYKSESAQIMQILATSGAKIEPMSIDEAYLDISSVLAPAFPAPLDHEPSTKEHDLALQAAVPLAEHLKSQIRVQRGLTATIGIAGNKFLAKLASGFKKPNGLTVIPETDKADFLRPLPVRSIYGVGRVTESVLQDAGINTIGDLQDYRGDLRALVGSFAPGLQNFAFGRDDRPLELGESIKSISNEETFPRDTEDRLILSKSLREQAAAIANKLGRKRLAAHTVQVKIRYGDFTTLTRQISVDEPITRPEEIYRLACFLLARDRLVHRPLRLLGLGVITSDPPNAQQLHLW
jgi:DNA polymerase-4